MGRIVHIEITADDMERAKKFYEIFGWEIKDSGMEDIEYLLATTGDKEDMGIDGAIMPRRYNEQPVIPTISVDNLEDMIKKVKASGGTIPGEQHTIPGVGEFVYGVDTEGNKFGMLQPLDQ